MLFKLSQYPILALRPIALQIIMQKCLNLLEYISLIRIRIAFHIQGIFSGVSGANSNIENIGKVEKKRIYNKHS